MGTSFTQEEENIVSFLESTAARLDRIAEDRNRRIPDHRELGQESHRLGQMLLDTQDRVIELLDIFRTVSHTNRLLRRQRAIEASFSERKEIYRPVCDEVSDQKRKRYFEISEVLVQPSSHIQTSTQEIRDQHTSGTQTDMEFSEIDTENTPGLAESPVQKSPKKVKKTNNGQVDEINSMSADVYRNIPKPPEGRYLRVLMECRRLARRCSEFFRAAKRPFIVCYRSNRESE